MAVAETTEQVRLRTLAQSMHPALVARDLSPLPEMADGDEAPASVDSPVPLISASGENRAALLALYRHWQSQFPGAGAPYWSVRCWTLLHWQPCFLAVTAVHGAGVLPPLTALKQELSGQGIVAGYQLPAQGWRQADPGEVSKDDTFSKDTSGNREAISEAGAMLAKLCEHLLNQLNQVTALKPLSARRLVADTLLLALRELPRVIPGVTPRQVLTLSQQWLSATGLDRQSALVPVRLDCGRQALVLDRKGCCMDYRREGGAVCASCPRLKRPERLQRQMEELSHAADTV